jgi:hypothetical protein
MRRSNVAIAGRCPVAGLSDIFHVTIRVRASYHVTVGSSITNTHGLLTAPDVTPDERERGAGAGDQASLLS